MIYQQEAQAGNVLMPALSGSASSGYSGTVGIGLSGLPAGTGSRSGSGSAGSGSSGSGSSGNGSASDSKVEAKLLGRTFERSGGRRELTLRIEADERVAANAQLLRGGKPIAHKRIAALAGTRKLAIPIGGAIPAGPASLRLTLTDRSGTAKTIRRRVTVPAP